MTNEVELDSPRRVDKALVGLRKRKYKRVNLPQGREYVDPCPIHTLDEAILWLAETGGSASFFTGHIVVCAEDESYTSATRNLGNGFDARGTLMMATRDLWMLLHGEAKQ